MHYFSSNPDAAWSEWLRYEGLTEPEDLMGIRGRVMWLVEVDLPELPATDLPTEVLAGGLDSHAECRREAARLRAGGQVGLRAPSAAIDGNGARLHFVDGGDKVEPCKSEVIVLFGPRPDLRAQLCAVGRPPARLLEHVRHLPSPSS